MINVDQGRVLPLSGWDHGSLEETENLQNHRTLRWPRDASLHHILSVGSRKDFTRVSSHRVYAASGPYKAMSFMILSSHSPVLSLTTRPSLKIGSGVLSIAQEGASL